MIGQRVLIVLSFVAFGVAATAQAALPPVYRAAKVAKVAVVKPALVSSSTYHVDPANPGASDSNPGTQSLPWKTAAKAAATAQPGDTVYLHAGRYAESVTTAAAGSRTSRATFLAYLDDDVIFDGADAFAADRWTLEPGRTAIYATPAGSVVADPGQVLLDGSPVYMKLAQASVDYQPGLLTDADINLYQYDAANRRVLLNAGGGNPGLTHTVLIPVRATAWTLGAGALLGKVRVRNYSGVGIVAAGDDSVVQDCLVSDCGGGIAIGGAGRRYVFVRRNTVLRALQSGIVLEDHPDDCYVQENLVLRCNLNPWRSVINLAGIRVGSAVNCFVMHNLVLETANLPGSSGTNGWGIWTRGDSGRVMIEGNLCANNAGAGLYIEGGASDSMVFWNTSYLDGQGITIRQSQRGMFQGNYIQSSRGAGITTYQALPPFAPSYNAFGHNLVKGCNPCVSFQAPNLQCLDYNTYWPLPGRPLATNGRSVYSTIEQFRSATGQEIHGEVRDGQMSDAGLDTVTFRVSDAADPEQVLMMLGNSACEMDDPSNYEVLPYFWHEATGDRADHDWQLAVSVGIPNSTTYDRGHTYAFPGAGACLVQRTANYGLNNVPPHGGLRVLEVNGAQPDSMCAQGFGFASPVLCARAGDVFNASFWIRGQSLTPKAGVASALAACAEFTDDTGQHLQRLNFISAPQAGSFEWKQLAGSVTVPAGAKRVRFFLGLMPCTGSVWFDDISVKLATPAAPMSLSLARRPLAGKLRILPKTSATPGPDLAALAAALPARLKAAKLATPLSTPQAKTVAKGLAGAATAGASYHVAMADPAASDANPGTQALPWKTAARAAAVAQAGDTVYFHAGRYPEQITVTTAATAASPIWFKPYQDDAVLFDGADTFDASQWTLVTGFTNVYASANNSVPADAGLLLIDGQVVCPKAVKVGYEMQLAHVTDSDTLAYEYDSTNRRVLVTVGGGNPAASHTISVPVRSWAFSLTSNGFRLSGFTFKHYAGGAVNISGSDDIVEDCVFRDTMQGPFVGSWGKNLQRATMRRNSVIDVMGTGITIQARWGPFRVEDNLALRCAINPWYQQLWHGTIKIYQGGSALYLNNVALEGGNQYFGATGYWEDGYINRTFYVGNVAANNYSVGYYFECGVEDTHALYNTSINNSAGFSTRQSARGVVVTNCVQDCSRGLEIGPWPLEEDRVAVCDDNFMAGNLVRGITNAVNLAIVQPQYMDHNTFWPSPDSFGWGGSNFYSTLAQWQTLTGHEKHSRAADLQLEDMGWDRVTFRVADAKNNSQTFSMMGNAGCELADAAEHPLLPYFWRAGSGDRAERVVTTAAAAGVANRDDLFAYGGAGGTVALCPTLSNVLAGSEGAPHGGKRFLQITGLSPVQMCPQGLGFWSPSLPTRPGDTMRLTFYVRSKDLLPSGANGLAAFVEFSDLNGQHRQQVDLTGGAVLTGTSGWTMVTAAAVVPATGHRMAFFVGMKPGTGTLSLDDISILAQ